MFTLFACSIFYVISDTKTEEGTESKTSASVTSGIAIYLEDMSDADTYSLSSSKDFPTALYTLNTSESICTNGGVITQDSETKTVSVTTTGSDSCTLYYDFCTENTLACFVVKQADTTSTPDFSQIADTDEGVFAMEDDYGTSYYFRGAVENNYVYFAGYYWRIVRVNGDGTVRIIYDGSKSAYANGTSSTDRYISTSEFNPEYNYNADVGYMYGTLGSSSYKEEHINTNSSTIKEVLDTWYENNLLGTEYESYLGDAVFCNDRSLSSGNGYSLDADTNYSASVRLNNYSPQLICNQQNDAFTVDDTTYGNEDLTYPIGLITADEVSLSGEVAYTTNSKYYLYIGSGYWTMTPHSYYSSGLVVYVYADHFMYGMFNGYILNYKFAVRPVINLKADVLISSGDGTADSPFEVTM